MELVAEGYWLAEGPIDVSSLETVTLAEEEGISVTVSVGDELTSGNADTSIVGSGKMLSSGPFGLS